MKLGWSAAAVDTVSSVSRRFHDEPVEEKKSWLGKTWLALSTAPDWRSHDEPVDKKRAGWAQGAWLTLSTAPDWRSHDDLKLQKKSWLGRGLAGSVNSALRALPR